MLNILKKKINGIQIPSREKDSMQNLKINLKSLLKKNDELIGKNIIFEVKKAFGNTIYVEIKPFTKKGK